MRNREGKKEHVEELCCRRIDSDWRGSDVDLSLHAMFDVVTNWDALTIGKISV